MNRRHIAVVVGSLRRDSLNQKLADALVRLAPPDLSFSQVVIGGLPLYNQDDDAAPAESVVRLKRALTDADGFIFITPEYNRSIPGVLKNAIDHASRPYGQSAWAGKPAGVLGISPGAMGTSMAQQHLRNVLSYLDVPTLGQPEVFIQAREGLFGAGGAMAADTRLFLQAWMDRYYQWVLQFSVDHVLQPT
jgi:chromate reductase